MITTADVAATLINFAADGTLRIANGQTLEGPVTATTNNNGTVTFDQGATMTGNLGSNGGNILKLVTIGGSAAGTVAASGAIDATTINFATDSTLTIADNQNVTAAITVTTGGEGTLTSSGTSTFTGQIGTSSNALKDINAGAATDTSTFKNDVFTGVLDVTGTGNVALEGDLTGTLDFEAAGTVTVSADKTVDAVTNTSGAAAGTLTFSGTTTTGGDIGSIGTATQQLTAVNFNGGTASVGHDIGATTITIADGATATYTASQAYDGNLVVGGGTTGTLTLATFTLTGTGNGAGTGAITTDAGSTIATTVTGAAVGNVTTAGNATVNADTAITITVASSSGVTTGTQFTIIMVGGCSQTTNSRGTIARGLAGPARYPPPCHCCHRVLHKHHTPSGCSRWAGSELG